jgi:hypothetical protein
MSSAGDILAAKFQVLEQLGSKSILPSLYRSIVNLTTSLSLQAEALVPYTKLSRSNPER